MGKKGDSEMNIKERVKYMKQAMNIHPQEWHDDDLEPLIAELERLWNIEKLAQTAISNMQDDGIPLSHVKGMEELAHAVMKKVGE